MHLLSMINQKGELKTVFHKFHQASQIIYQTIKCM